MIELWYTTIVHEMYIITNYYVYVCIWIYNWGIKCSAPFTVWYLYYDKVISIACLKTVYWIYRCYVFCIICKEIQIFILPFLWLFVARTTRLSVWKVFPVCSEAEVLSLLTTGTSIPWFTKAKWTKTDLIHVHWWVSLELAHWFVFEQNIHVCWRYPKLLGWIHTNFWSRATFT